MESPDENCSAKKANMSGIIVIIERCICADWSVGSAVGGVIIFCCSTVVRYTSTGRMGMPTLG